MTKYIVKRSAIIGLYFIMLTFTNLHSQSIKIPLIYNDSVHIGPPVFHALFHFLKEDSLTKDTIIGFYDYVFNNTLNIKFFFPKFRVEWQDFDWWRRNIRIELENPILEGKWVYDTSEREAATRCKQYSIRNFLREFRTQRQRSRIKDIIFKYIDERVFNIIVNYPHGNSNEIRIPIEITPAPSKDIKEFRKRCNILRHQIGKVLSQKRLIVNLQNFFSKELNCKYLKKCRVKGTIKYIKRNGSCKRSGYIVISWYWNIPPPEYMFDGRNVWTEDFLWKDFFNPLRPSRQSRWKGIRYGGFLVHDTTENLNTILRILNNNMERTLLFYWHSKDDLIIVYSPHPYSREGVQRVPLKYYERFRTYLIEKGILK